MKRMIQVVADRLPTFEDFTIRQYREKGLEKIPQLLDAYFRTVMVKSELRYVSHRTLDPLESLEWQMNWSLPRKNLDISTTTFVTEQFTFMLGDMEYKARIQLPFMYGGAIYINGAKYYPQLLIAERLILPMRDQVTINKAGVVTMQFYRAERRQIKSVDGKSFTQFIIQSKLHWGKRQRFTPPLLLYHLVEFGFTKGLSRYTFQVNGKEFYVTENVITVTDNDTHVDGYTFFQIHPNLFIRVMDEALRDNRILRLLVALHYILKSWSNYNINDVFDKEATLFKIVLGKLTNTTANNPTQFVKFANNHMETYAIMFDDAIKRACFREGYDCKSMADFLTAAFYNIDAWLLQKPQDLFTMMIAMSEKFAENLIQTIGSALFNMYDKSRNGIKPENATTFVNKLSSINLRWFRSLCRSEPCIVNGNWLLSIGIKSRRVFIDNMDKASQSPKKAGKLAREMTRSHYSWPVVESNVAWPSKNPIIVSTLNPYLKIDEEGYIVVPEWVEEIKHIFD